MLRMLCALLAALATGAFIFAWDKVDLPKGLGERWATLGLKLKRAQSWRQRRHERHAIAKAWPGLLSQLGGALRAGESLEQAFNSAQATAPKALLGPLASFNAGLGLGADLGLTLDALALDPRMALVRDSLRSLATAVQIQREIGGNLAEILDHLVEQAHEREGFQAQVEALTAQGRLSALIVGALPLVLFAGMTLMDPALTEPLWGRPLGWGLLLGAVLLEALGFWALRIVTRITV